MEEGMKSYKMEVNKEDQRNDFCHDLLKAPFLKHRYIQIYAEEHYRMPYQLSICNMDMYFYKMDAATVNAALIKHKIGDDQDDK